jgi:catechol 2,3-dioxygenase-like lactoylglutathione lyase family enzyme
MTDIHTIPILVSLDLDETEHFYGDRLGFELVGRFGDYLLMRRGMFELHFRLADDHTICEMTACYIRGGGVPALYEEFKTKTFETGRISDFSVRPWNMKEFYITDPHGNLLKFGCAPEECLSSEGG